MARTKPKPVARRARTAQAARTPPRAGKATPAKTLAPTAAPAAFTRGARLSLPDDEPSGPVEFEELAEVTNPRQRAFLQALIHTPRVSFACRAAGISTVAAYKWRTNERDVAFHRALAVAVQLGLERAESEGWRRGVDGYEKPVYYQGRLIGTERVFSDTMLQFMLRANKPERYAEKVRLEGAGGGPIQTQALDADSLTDEEIQQRLELVKRSLGAAVKQIAEQAVDAKVAELDPVAEYEKVLAARAKNGNGNGS
jgi:hypothetical protein